MPAITITHRTNGSTLWEGEAGSLREAVVGAVRAGIDLGWANLRGADLRVEDLGGAKLGAADLRGANLRGADFRGANLCGADLRGAEILNADLCGANIGGANLDYFRNDLILAILYLPDEIPFLRQALVEGKIDGSTYRGDCACLAGTMAHACGMSWDDFKAAGKMPVNASSPREQWFTLIRPGQTPENHEVSRVTLGWVDEALALVAKVRGTRTEGGAGLESLPALRG